MEILRRIKSGDIDISPFNEKQLNPNSYNLTLSNELICYTLGDGYLDMKKKNATYNIIIPDDGFILKPGNLYLAKTVERCSSMTCVPIINSRSSIGRLGVNAISSGAGFGDIGYDGTFTLHITTTLPVKIYPWIHICQVEWDESIGDNSMQYNGKYSGTDIQPSKTYEDFI